MSPPEIKTAALELEIPLIQPEDVNSAELIDRLKEIDPDVIITVAYGGYLKKTIRKIPALGCLNLHPSLLPKYRGASPINYTLFNNDRFTGNTIFKIAAKMDAGPILFQSKIEIKDSECFTDIYKKLSESGAKDIIATLELLEKDKIIPLKQDEQSVTFSEKINKHDLLLDWSNSAGSIRNKVRGLAEKPGATATFRGNRIKIIETDVLDSESDKASGTIIDIIKNSGIIVSTGSSNILLKKVQPAGKKIMNSYAFHLGARIKPNEKFENGF